MSVAAFLFPVPMKGLCARPAIAVNQLYPLRFPVRPIRHQYLAWLLVAAFVPDDQYTNFVINLGNIRAQASASEKEGWDSFPRTTPASFCSRVISLESFLPSPGIFGKTLQWSADSCVSAGRRPVCRKLRTAWFHHGVGRACQQQTSNSSLGQTRFSPLLSSPWRSSSRHPAEVKGATE